MTDSRTGYVLTGPTASGKTSLAHRMARRNGWTVLSADSMLVYRGMDIGTAKPTKKERGEVRYLGIDLADPDCAFSVGDYLEAVRRQCTDQQPGEPIIVAGGTGLYLRALLEGLPDMPPAQPALRKEAEELLESGGAEALVERIRASDPARYEALEDHQNPRRLVRAYELARQGIPVDRQWYAAHLPVIAGLHAERGVLEQRIAERVDRMFSQGLVDEVKQLIRTYPAFSSTAGQAIGYREVIELLEERLDRETARNNMIVRTRRLAKKQMTWFRHQLNVEWIDAAACSEEQQEQRIHELWEKHGPVRIHI